MSDTRNVVRTLATLAGLMVTLPIDALMVVLALVRRARKPRASRPTSFPRTVLITGGKMTKALQLARSFHCAGHRVILAESAKYRFTGHRFSRAVDAFYCLPEPTAPGYDDALFELVRYEAVDTFVPVSSPSSSVHDARARYLLDGICEVMHAGEDIVRMLDDKAEFSKLAVALGLRVPDWMRITDPQQILNFDFPAGRSYVLKRIAYNPVGRLDLPRLSKRTPQHNAALAQWLPISEDDPWILQEFIAGAEYCTHGTVDQRTTPGVCLLRILGIPTQLRDGRQARDPVVGRAVCRRPRRHRPVLLRFHPGRGRRSLCHRMQSAHPLGDHDVSQSPAVGVRLSRGRPSRRTPLADARPTYWIYHEMWRLLTQRGRRARLKSILRGKDAIFAWWDPLPYLMVHHLQIPALLIDNLRRRRGWTKIDFNIGKLVEPDGD